MLIISNISCRLFGDNLVVSTIPRSRMIRKIVALLGPFFKTARKRQIKATIAPFHGIRNITFLFNAATKSYSCINAILIEDALSF